MDGNVNVVGNMPTASDAASFFQAPPPQTTITEADGTTNTFYKKSSAAYKYVAKHANIMLEKVTRKHFWFGVFLYIICPSIVFFVVSPGLFLSVPAVQNCDTKQESYWRPQQVNWKNALVAAVFFFLLLFLWFWLMSKTPIPFPFHINVLES